MAAAQFEMLPAFALQLAVRVEAYCVALRSGADAAQEPRNFDATAAVNAITELARSVPALWIEWSRFAAAHADFRLAQIMQPASLQLEANMSTLDEAAEALMLKSVRWAIFEQQQFPVPVDVAHAFIEWEAARKVYFQIRQAETQVRAQRTEGDESDALLAASEELHAKWEAQCAALLLEAVRLLGAQN